MSFELFLKEVDIARPAEELLRFMAGLKWESSHEAWSHPALPGKWLEGPSDGDLNILTDPKFLQKDRVPINRICFAIKGETGAFSNHHFFEPIGWSFEEFLGGALMCANTPASPSRLIGKNPKWSAQLRDICYFWVKIYESIHLSICADWTMRLATLFLSDKQLTDKVAAALEKSGFSVCHTYDGVSPGPALCCSWDDGDIIQKSEVTTLHPIKND